MANRQSPKRKNNLEVEPSLLVHIDDFLNTAIPLFGISAMQAAGFKARMQGRLYQTSMDSFLKELELYLGKKLK